MLAGFKMGGMLGGLLKPTFAYITSNTGLTENFDVAPESAHILGASVQCTTAETPRTMTCAITGGAGIGGVSAIWR